jgi:hypothetical protein
VWFLDVLYRDHAEVEDRVKAIKRIGLGLLPSKSWQLNAAWILAAGRISPHGGLRAVGRSTESTHGDFCADGREL